jgi:hypothetical protein
LSTSNTSWPFSSSLDGGEDVARRLVEHRYVQHVALLQRGVVGRDPPLAEAGEERHPGTGAHLELRDRGTDPVEGGRQDIDTHPAGRVPVSRLRAVRQQSPEELVGGPSDADDGRDAEPFVDLCAAGVVDPGHHGLDAERLPGDSRGDDVGVVTAADRGEGVGTFDAGRDEYRAVETEPGDPLTGEGRAETPERLGVGVDHGDGMAALLEAVGERRADPAATHDDEVHVGPSACCQHPTLLRDRVAWGPSVPSRHPQ